jgi:hypothetical protein
MVLMRRRTHVFNMRRRTDVRVLLGVTSVHHHMEEKGRRMRTHPMNTRGRRGGGCIP